MSLAKNLKRHLLTGFLVLAPISVSLMLLAWFVSFLDGLLAPLVWPFFGRRIPGLGLVSAALILVGAGFLSSNIAGQHLVELVEELLLRIPGFRFLYSTVKQLAEVFSPGGNVRFQSVVLVEYPRPEVLSLGFVTNRLEVERDGVRRAMVCVYIPTNHLYIGDILLVPQEAVRDAGLTLQEGIQVILSAGATLPARLPGSRP